MYYLHIMKMVILTVIFVIQMIWKKEKCGEVKQAGYLDLSIFINFIYRRLSVLPVIAVNLIIKKKG